MEILKNIRTANIVIYSTLSVLALSIFPAKEKVPLILLLFLTITLLLWGTINLCDLIFKDERLRYAPADINNQNRDNCLNELYHCLPPKLIN